MKKLFIITGDYSGDIHAGKVAEILKQKSIQKELKEKLGNGAK